MAGSSFRRPRQPLCVISHDWTTKRLTREKRGPAGWRRATLIRRNGHCSLTSGQSKALAVAKEAAESTEMQIVGNDLVTLINHFANQLGADGGAIMSIWLEYDAVAFAVLVFGIVVIELLVLSI